MLAAAQVLAVSDRYTVYALVALLTAVGIAMVVLTVWLVKMTRPEHESLSALEVMSSRRFRREGTLARERRLAAVRGPVVAVDASPATEDETPDPVEPDATGTVPRLDPWDASPAPDGSSAVLGDESEAAEIVDSGEDPGAPTELEEEDIAAEPDEPDPIESVEAAVACDDADEDQPAADADEPVIDDDEGDEDEGDEDDAREARAQEAGGTIG